MKDRISKYPGRVKLIPVQGQENVFDLERADEPEVEGTTLNKGNLLSDEAASSFKLYGDMATPSEAFKKIKNDFMNVGNVHIWVYTSESGESQYFVSGNRYAYPDGDTGVIDAYWELSEEKTELLCVKGFVSYPLQVYGTFDESKIIVDVKGNLTFNETENIYKVGDLDQVIQITEGMYFVYRWLYTDGGSETGLVPGTIYYMPPGAKITITDDGNNNYTYTLDKYHEVLGVPRTKAGNYRYMGRVGDALNILVGTYTGDGTRNRIISLPITPRALLIVSVSGRMGYPTEANAYSHVSGGLALKDSPVYLGGLPAIEITTNGFIVDSYTWDSYAWKYIETNSSGSIYHYIAIC